MLFHMSLPSVAGGDGLGVFADYTPMRMSGAGGGSRGRGYCAIGRSSGKVEREIALATGGHRSFAASVPAIVSQGPKRAT